MKKLLTMLATAALVATLLVPASAGPTAGGYATDNVEYVGFVPFEQSTSTGVTLQGKFMYLTSWKNISTYDISDPTAPQLLDTEPLGFKFENEQVAVSPDGSFLLFSESLPENILHVYDVEDKTNITKISEVPGAGDHTTSCVLKCNWAYGSDGAVTDLRNPAKPKLAMTKGAEFNWHKEVGIAQGAHDVEEYKNGFILVSTLDEPFRVVDVRNPLKPKVVYLADKHPDRRSDGGFLFHSGLWPRGGKDKWVLMQGEANFKPQCDPKRNGPFMSWTLKGSKFTMVDKYAVTNGTYQDGGPPANALGCSAHWFDEHATFKNGGLVAVGYYEHGTRFLDVAKTGKIKEAGYFVPWGGSTSAAYWANKNIVYAVDYVRGIDILKFTGKT